MFVGRRYLRVWTTKDEPLSVNYWIRYMCTFMSSTSHEFLVSEKIYTFTTVKHFRSRWKSFYICPETKFLHTTNVANGARQQSRSITILFIFFFRPTKIHLTVPGSDKRINWRFSNLYIFNVTYSTLTHPRVCMYSVGKKSRFPYGVALFPPSLEFGRISFWIKHNSWPSRLSVSPFSNSFRPLLTTRSKTSMIVRVDVSRVIITLRSINC